MSLRALSRLLLIFAVFYSPISALQSWAAPVNKQRTVILIYGQTQSGQDMFLRGGIDGAWSNANRGTTCNSATGGDHNKACSIPITHLNSLHAYANPWRIGDNYLDWGKLKPAMDGREPNQNGTNSKGEYAVGTPAVWTTNDPNYAKKVDVIGSGYTPLNTYGPHYWMLDVEIDCANNAVNGWLEFKSFISNGPGWEPNVSQTQFGGLTPPPYKSGNHFAKCGMLNVFSRGSGNAQILSLPTTLSADFVVFPNPVDTNVQIRFDASKSQGAYRYVWDWESDGNADTGQLSTPTIEKAFSAAGTYNVTLKVIAADGKTATKQIPVTVHAAGAQIRTVVFIKKQTAVGQNLFIRGGIDLNYANSNLGLNCTLTNYLCAIPHKHNILPNDPNRANDRYLDWLGIEPGQDPAALGSPMAWTTNLWLPSSGPKKTLALDGYGEDPENIWGEHYWKLDVTNTVGVSEWFEFKALMAVNGVETWEPDVNQANRPWISSNHFAKKGCINVAEWGSSSIQHICPPSPCYVMNPNPVKAGETLEINASCSKNATAYRYVFTGPENIDSGWLNGQSNSIYRKTFSTLGNYNAVLQVRNDHGQVVVSPGESLEVKPQSASCDFVLDKSSVALGGVVNATAATSPGVTNFSWQFGDGAVFNGGNSTSASHTYNQFGQFSVTLSCTSSIGQILTAIRAVNVFDDAVEAGATGPASLGGGGGSEEGSPLELPIPPDVSNYTTSTVGKIDGDFNVTMGQSSYNIPIKVPPGRGGMEPSLALTYGAGGDGSLGKLWGLAGLPKIERCGRTWVLDNEIRDVELSRNDYFCMDGQRLVAINGAYGFNNTEYRTLSESFSKIVSYDADGYSPGYFKVWTKDGKILTLGSSEVAGENNNARYLANGTAVPAVGQQVMAWHVNRFADRSGNFITVGYNNIDTATEKSIVPREIIYTHHTSGHMGTRKVQFYYESDFWNSNFTPPIRQYDNSGTWSELRRRLMSIETYVSDTIVGRMKLTYGGAFASDPNRDAELSTVTLCAYDQGIDSTSYERCLKPTIINWNERNIIDEGFDTLPVSLGSAAYWQTNIPIDINGDGRTDMVYIKNDRWHVRIANGDETQNFFNAEFDTNISATGAYVGNNADGCVIGATSCSESQLLRSYYARPIDYNGDGLTDLLVPGQTGTPKKWDVLVSTGNTFERQATALDLRGEANNPQVIDVNGDGLLDLVTAFCKDTGDCPVANAIRWHVAINQKGIFSAYSKTAIYTVTTSANIGRIRSLDYNADGRLDILVADGSQYVVLRSTGNGLEKITTSSLVSSIPGSIALAYDANNAPLIFDINGDALPDILGLGTDAGVRKYRLWLNVGGKFATQWLKWGADSPVALGINHHVVMDYNQDGRDDLLIPGDNGWKILTSTGVELLQHNNSFGSNILYSGLGKNPSLMDVDGDGYTDFLNVNAANEWLVHPNSNRGYWVAPRQVERINEGGSSNLSSDVAWKSIKIQSKPISRSDVYTPGLSPGFGCSYPLACVNGAPLWVVSSVKMTNGTISHPSAIDASYSETIYRYRGLRMHLRGQGSLGFTSIETENMDSGEGGKRIVDRQIFDQDKTVSLYAYGGLWNDGTLYTHIGFPAKEESWLGMPDVAGSFKISAIHSQFATKILGASNAEKRYFISPEKITDYSYAYNVGFPHGSTIPISAIAAISQTDDYGNITSVVEGHVNGGRLKTTVHTLKPADTSNWIINQIERTEVTHQATGKTALKRTSKFEYTANAQLWKTTVEPDAANVVYQHVTENHYDAWGNVDWVEFSGHGVAKRRTTTTYEPEGYFPQTVTNPAGLSEHRIYNKKFGAITHFTDANNLVTNYHFDAFGRKILEVRPDKTWTLALYGPSNNAALSVVNLTSGGGYSKQEIDILGRNVLSRKMTDWALSQSSITQTRYDALGRVSRLSRPYFADLNNESSAVIKWIDTTYDALSRPIKTTYPDGSSSRIEIDRISTYEYDATGQKTTKQINEHGLTTSVTDQLGNTISYGYDVFGNVETMTMMKGSTSLVTQIGYDLYGRKISINDPDMGAWTYAYNVYGELISQKDAKQQTTSMTYDGIGRMVTRTGLEGTTTWVYDTALYGKGKVDYITAPGYAEKYKYDKQARMLDATYTVDNKDFVASTRYDGLGRPRILSYPTTGSVSNLVVHYYYDDADRLFQVKDHTSNALYWERTAEDAEGHITGERYGNGVTTVRGFDSNTGQLLSINAGANNAVQNEMYRYDAAGNLLARTNQWLKANQTQYFGYDDLHRLTCVVANADTSLNNASRAYCGNSAASKTMYKYDGLGNLINKPDVGGADFTYGDANNPAIRPHAVYSAGGQNYAYDANGNMLTGAGRTIAWASFNKPTRVSKGNAVLDLAYDANYNRIIKNVVQNGTTRKTLYVGGMYEVTTEANAQKHRFYVNSNETVAIVVKEPLKPQKTLYLHKDHLGSATAITDQDAKVVERLAFDVWGKTIAAEWKDNQYTPSIGLLRGFTGHEMDEEVGLVNMKGRLYDPVLGRFISPDSLVQMATHTQSLNRYTYVMNNPLAMVDPSGYSWLSKKWKQAKRGVKRLGRAIGGVLRGIGDFAVDTFHYLIKPATALLAGVIEGIAQMSNGGSFWNGFDDGMKYGWNNPRRILRHTAKMAWDLATLRFLRPSEEPYDDAKKYNSQQALIDAYRDDENYVVLRGYRPLGDGGFSEWAAEGSGATLGGNNKGLYHEEVVIITPQGDILYFGFQQFNGISQDESFWSGNIENGYYRFSHPMKIPATVGEGIFDEVKRSMLPNYRPKDYNLSFHNCQDFADEYRANLRRAAKTATNASTLSQTTR